MRHDPNLTLSIPQSALLRLFAGGNHGGHLELESRDPRLPELALTVALNALSHVAEELRAIATSGSKEVPSELLGHLWSVGEQLDSAATIALALDKAARHGDRAEAGVPAEDNGGPDAVGGSNTTRAIQAAILDIEGVQRCRVFENDTDETNQDGLPPHSFEVLVFDASSPVPDVTIAQAILDEKAAGIRTFGSVTADAIDENGEARPVSFSRPTEREVWIETELAVVDGFESDEAAAAHIVARARELYGLGDSVRRRQLDSVAFELAGVDDVTAFTLGFAPAPVGTTSLAIGPREIATFDTSRTTVTHTP